MFLLLIRHFPVSYTHLFENESNDAKPEFIKENCSIIQIAKYNDDDSLYILHKYWVKLDDLDKLALILHETFYKRLRDWFHEDSSVNTRQMIQVLLSKNPINKDFSDIENLQKVVMASEKDLLLIAPFCEKKYGVVFGAKLNNNLITMPTDKVTCEKAAIYIELFIFKYIKTITTVSYTHLKILCSRVYKKRSKRFVFV